MRRKMWSAGLFLLAAGCGLQARVRQAPAEEGAERVHPAGFRETFEAAERALDAAGFVRREQGWMGPDRRCLLAGSALGRAARIVVEDHPTDCRVWILVKSPFGDAASDDEAAHALHDGLARVLGEGPRPPPQEAQERELLAHPGLEACAEAARQAAASAGFDVRPVDDIPGELRTMSGLREDGTRVFLALYRRPEGGTRLVAEVRGPAFDALELLECSLESALARDAAAVAASEK